MKTLVNKFMWVMVMVMGFSFVSCDKENEFGDGEEWLAPAKTDPTPDTTTTPIDSIDWGMDMEKTFGYVKQTGLWPSTITLHYKDGKDSTFCAYCPMTSVIEAPAEVIVDSTASTSRLVGNPIFLSKDSTNWEHRADNKYYRTITTKWALNMGNYEAILTSTHVEAYMMREGKYVYFKHGNEPAPILQDDNSSAGEDALREAKTYTVENSHLCMKHVLHASKTEYPESTTRVLREKPVVEEEMPTPDLKVSTFVLVYNITFSPEFVGNTVIWHKVCLTRNIINGKEYFSIWVDGVFVRTVELKSNERNDLYNSAYLADGVWVPAILKYSSSNDGGWDYTFVVSDEAKMKTVDQRMAVTSGLSNFKKDNDASQTPSVYTTTSVKEYGTKKLVTVTGFDKDNRPVISFTIGECL